jgi:hypothetical protein
MQAYNSMTGLHMLSTRKPYDTDEPIHVFLDLSGVGGAKSAARHRSRSVSGQAHTEVPNFQTVWLPSSNSLSRVCLIPIGLHPANARFTPLHFHRHKHQRQHSRKRALHDRPNVLLSHGHDGIHVRLS